MFGSVVVFVAGELVVLGVGDALVFGDAEAIGLGVGDADFLVAPFAANDRQQARAAMPAVTTWRLVFIGRVGLDARCTGTDRATQ